MARSRGFDFIGLFVKANVTVGLASRSETESAFTRALLSDRRQVMLYGLALLLMFLPTELGFMQRVLGTTALTGEQWVLCIVCTVGLLLIEEVMEFFMRRSLKRKETSAA